MVNVQTLRIIGGHQYITTALLRGFLGRSRQAERPIRRLWLESCYLSVLSFPSLNPLDFKLQPVTAPGSKWYQPRQCGLDQLESLRIRRLRLGTPQSGRRFGPSRGGPTQRLHSGKGGLYETTMSTTQEKFFIPHLLSLKSLDKVSDFLLPSRWFNEQIFKKLPEVDQFFIAKRPLLPDDGIDDDIFDEISETDGVDAFKSGKALARSESALYTILSMLEPATDTLTSLNIDWLIFYDSAPKEDGSGDDLNARVLLWKLSTMRFPHLRALQLRNAACDNTKVPSAVYLLHPVRRGHEHLKEVDGDSPAVIDFLTFLEEHPKIQCLAWPMDRFYHHQPVDKEEEDRASAVVNILGRTLVSLRIDAEYRPYGEPHTDANDHQHAQHMRIRRRKFVSKFAPKMTHLKHLKMEGGLPKDEYRETIRAVHRCPLEKMVMIGITWPLGNSWGLNGRDLAAFPEAGALNHFGILEEEPKEAVMAATREALPPIVNDYTFVPEYGWPECPPMLHTIATFHADTITELKFCGYQGAATLHVHTELMLGLLHPLRYFNNLQNLVLSIWLLTYHDNDWREQEVIQYWLQESSDDTVPYSEDAIVAKTENRIVPIMNDDPITIPSTFENGLGYGDFPIFEDAASTEGDFAGQVISNLDFSAIQSATTSESSIGHENMPPAATLEDGNAAVAALHDAGPDPDEDMARVLMTKYHPRVIAKEVSELLLPHLSPKAVARRSQCRGENGVSVRASFCLGVEQSDIFDFDVWVDDSAAGVSGWRGPRAEAQWDRWWQKLESRLWFYRNGV